MSEQRRETRNSMDAARQLDAAVRARASAAAGDLFLPAGLRLSEWQRTTAGALLARLVRAIEDELRPDIAGMLDPVAFEALRAAFTSAHVAIAGPILDRLDALREPDLVTVLLRRAEEHRRYQAASPAAGDLLLDLVRGSDEAAAREAMALLIAQSRRFDRFQEPVMARTELPAELQHRLVWRVAAALRHYMVVYHDVPPAMADGSVIAAVERLLANYDEGEGLEAKSMRLAHRLNDGGLLGDSFVERALSGGRLPLFLGGLAVRASLDYASVWEILSDPRGRGAVLLLRGAGIGRDSAGAILLDLSQGGDLFPCAPRESAAMLLDFYDVTDAGEAADALRLWRADAGYRDAIASLAASSS